MSTTEPLPGLHPRMRARRVEVRREAGRRRLRLVLGMAATLGVAAAGWGMTRSPLLDIDQVEVSGAERTTRPELLDAAGLRRGDPMVDLDIATVEARTARLPWVGDVDIVRRWPGTVEVRITERTPVAAVRSGEGWALTDPSGRVLDVLAEPPPGVVTVEVATSDAALAPGAAVAGDHLDGVRLAASAASVPGGAVRSVHIEPGRGAVLGLAGGAEAIVGTTDELDAKLTALATLLTRVELARVITIDVRVPSAPVLTRG